MSYTHVCIQTPPLQNHVGPRPPALKKGDFATLKETVPHATMLSKAAYAFEEDKGMFYDISLFLPLPPQQEKTVYVAVSEEITKEIAEPILN